MSKFKIGDIAYYWELNCDDIFDVYLGEIDIENDVQARRYSNEYNVFCTKKEAMEAMYARLKEIENE